MFISEALAQGASGGGSGFLIQIMPLLIVLFLVFLGVRRSRKLNKLAEERLQSIEQRLSNLEK